jgi:SPP1 family predicted phage head-tail adaptor
MYNEVITLQKRSYSVDEYGDTVETLSTRDVFAEIRSIGMREKYEALQAGLDPEYTFVLADYFEYENEDECTYEGQLYRVIRTFRNGQTMELVVTRAADNIIMTTTASMSVDNINELLTGGRVGRNS